MRITCPSCEAMYDVPEAILTAGRKLRCARCQRDWHPDIAPPPPPPPPTPVPVFFASPPEASIPPPPRLATAAPDRMVPPALSEAPRHDPWLAQAPLVAGAWALSLLLLGALIFEGIAARKSIERVWPAYGRLYGDAVPQAVTRPAS